MRIDHLLFARHFSGSGMLIQLRTKQIVTLFSWELYSSMGISRNSLRKLHLELSHIITFYTFGGEMELGRATATHNCLLMIPDNLEA